LTTSSSIFDSTFDDESLLCLVIGSVELSFAEVRRRAFRMRVLVSERLGARPLAGARVAYVAHGDEVVHVLLLALVGMGATAVPIHPKLTVGERAVLLDVAHPDLFLDEAELLSAVADGSLDAVARALPPIAARDEEMPLAIVFTSGTTGRPKGALLSLRAFRASAVASAKALGWHPSDRWFLCMPLAHVGGIGVVLRCLLARKTVVHFGRRPFDATAALATMARTETTIASLVPTMLARFVESSSTPPPSLRIALLGGAAASPALLDRGRALGWPLVVTYGLTEACSHVTLGETADRSHDVGAPIPGTEVRVVDGQIAVRSRTLFSGYLDQPSPFDAEGFYATGDLGALDANGRLTIHARRTDLVVTGGENVYPREIELCLEEIAGVSSAAVFGVPDETWGQIVAMAVVVAEGGPSLEQLTAVLRTRLARHKLPRRGILVEELPTNALGKLLRGRLLELAGRLETLS